MKKSLLTLTTIMILSASMSLSAFAMTAEEVTAKTPTSYTAGTNSVYGSKLTQEQLNAVAQATADFMTNNITDGMDTDQKIKAAYDYIKNRTTYVDWNAVTGANTAYTLVTGQGACSGMCRSMKALCDAMGIECYHVHSTSNDHQWNLVRYGDGILYHVDIDANKSAGQDIIYKSLTHPLPFDTSAYPAVGQAQEQGQEQTQPTTPQPTDGQHTMRASDPNTPLDVTIGKASPNSTEEIHNVIQFNGVSVVQLDSDEFTFSVSSQLNTINPAGHKIWVNGYVFVNGIPFAIGEPKVYDFEYDKIYTLDYTGKYPTAESFYNYCQRENLMIAITIVDAEDSTSGHNAKVVYTMYK